jgi:hypothetical protein
MLCSSPSTLRQPHSAAWWARGATVRGGGAGVSGAHPPLLPTATDRPRGGLPDIGRGSWGGAFSVVRVREEGTPLTVLWMVMLVRAALSLVL